MITEIEYEDECLNHKCLCDCVYNSWVSTTEKFKEKNLVVKSIYCKECKHIKIKFTYEVLC